LRTKKQESRIKKQESKNQKSRSKKQEASKKQEKLKPRSKRACYNNHLILGFLTLVHIASGSKGPNPIRSIVNTIDLGLPNKEKREREREKGKREAKKSPGK